MKRLVIKLLCIAISAIDLNSETSFAQNLKQEYSLIAFSSIEISDDFDVTVIKGSDYFLELTVPEAYTNFVHSSVKGSTLSIDLDEKKIPTDIKKVFKGKDKSEIYRAIITMPGELKSIKMSGKTTLLVNQDIMSNATVAIEMTDNSTLKSLTVNANNVSINLGKKANATIFVNCGQLAVDVSGSSNLTLNQNTDNLDIKAQGNPTIDVKGETKVLDYQVKGTTKATLTGKAESAKFSCSGSSNTNAVDLELPEAVVEMNSICTLTEAASEKLSVQLSGGANLIFANSPVLDIQGIKSSSMSHYSSKD